MTLLDPYALRPEEIEDPPTRAWPILRRIGPGMILAASIVGSGELIATTTLGAEAGYVALWLVMLSCFVKPAVQAMIGRYSIVTGQTGLEAFDQVPGPRAKVGFIVWGWAAVVLMTLFQVGAMYGGTAQTLHILFPGIAVSVWVLILLAITLALLLGGGYERIEKLATLKVGLFTLITVMAALVLFGQPSFRPADLAQGLLFELPANGFAVAIAVFGITGVGATELMMYPYWCGEKGYARFTGQADGSDAWRRRAKGWTAVMRVDIFASMIIYTLATAAFFLLGAGILHPRGLNPDSNRMIPVLSEMYTQTLGPWALWLFYAGAIATLYGTIFAATAAHSRLYADLARLLGGFPRQDYAARVKWRQRFVVLLATVPAILFLTINAPVWMVKLGGIAQAALLPLLALGALWLRYYRLPKAAKPESWEDAGLWIATLLIVVASLFILRRLAG
jgi:Mn2+/Fe2+ NRAMP family transporter